MLWFKYCNQFKSFSSTHFLRFKSGNIFQNKNMSSDTEALNVYEVSFKSCGTVYDNWRQSKKFRTIPEKDLTFNVKYFDTDKMSTVKPIVFAIHGTPGNCHDFSCLTTYLHNNGVRVIIPSFPDFSTFPPGIFRHTEEERAQFVKDFLSAISVSKVDLLVCHSGGVYPALKLCLDQNLVVKSIVMLNPVSFSLAMPGIKNLWFFKLLVKASEVPILLRIIKLLTPILMKTSPVKGGDILNPILAATVMVNTDIVKMKEKFIQLSKTGIPILYALSENDKIVGKECAYELAYLLGANRSDAYFVNKDGHFEENGKETSSLKVVTFENGSHHVFWKYASIINDLVLQFLKRTSSKL